MNAPTKTMLDMGIFLYSEEEGTVFCFFFLNFLVVWDGDSELPYV